MIKISDEKWAKLPQIDDRLTEKYGPVGSPLRKEFQAKAEAWYFSAEPSFPGIRRQGDAPV